jgi:hypothetical protein
VLRGILMAMALAMPAATLMRPISRCSRPRCCRTGTDAQFLGRSPVLETLMTMWFARGYLVSLISSIDRVVARQDPRNTSSPAAARRA